MRWHLRTYCRGTGDFTRPAIAPLISPNFLSFLSRGQAPVQRDRQHRGHGHPRRRRNTTTAHPRLDFARGGYIFFPFCFQGDKYLMLKRRFRVAGCVGLPAEPSMSTATSLTSLTSYPGASPVQHSQSQDSLIDPPRFQQRSPMVSPSARYMNRLIIIIADRIIKFQRHVQHDYSSIVQATSTLSTTAFAGRVA